MAVARSSSGGVVIRYVFPVLWMTSYLLISQGCSSRRRYPAEAQCTRSLANWTHGTIFRVHKVATPGAEFAVCDCLIIQETFCCGLHHQQEHCKWWNGGAYRFVANGAISIYTVSQKTRHQTLGHNFTNYYPIINIFSLADSAVNLQQIHV